MSFTTSALAVSPCARSSSPLSRIVRRRSGNGGQRISTVWPEKGLVGAAVDEVEDAVAIAIELARADRRAGPAGPAEPEPQAGEAAPVGRAVALAQAGAGATEQLRAGIQIVGRASQDLEVILVDVAERRARGGRARHRDVEPQRGGAEIGKLVA